ncbi:MAG: flexitail domain-containing putative surface protein [Dehalococcoidia bacterium]
MRLRNTLTILGLAALAAVLSTSIVSFAPGGARPALAAAGCADIDGDGNHRIIDAVMINDYYGSNVPPAPVQVDMNKDAVIDLFNDIFTALFAYQTPTGCQGSALSKSTSSAGALAVDAYGEGTGASDLLQTSRRADVGETFHVTVHLTSNPGMIQGYDLEAHWSEALLDLNARTAEDNDLLDETPVSAVVVQLASPADNDSGSDAALKLGAMTLPGGGTTAYTGPIAQLEFTCEAAGTATVSLSAAPSTMLVAPSATQYNPSVASATVICQNPGALNVTGNWFVDIAGDNTGTCTAHLTQTGTAVTSLAECLVTSGVSQLFNDLSGSINLGTGNLALTGSGTNCAAITVDADVNAASNSLNGTWDCGAFSGTLGGTIEHDGDGIEDNIDTDPSTFSSAFNDGAGTTGTVTARNGLTAVVRDAPNPSGVRYIAIGGPGGPAMFSTACTPVATDSLDPYDNFLRTCGSVETTVYVGPVTTTIGGYVMSAPAGAVVTVQDVGGGDIQFFNEPSSSASINVAGIILAPGNAVQTIPDSDGDGLDDITEGTIGSTVGDTDSDDDGIPDGMEYVGFGTDPTEIDSDNDGCKDPAELDDNEELGGRRSPTNPYDFYDVDGNKDIDLFIDIFGVAGKFGLQLGDLDYIAAFDRSAPPTSLGELNPNKREGWDMGPPDGLIDLFNDIFGVAFQYGHNCT